MIISKLQPSSTVDAVKIAGGNLPPTSNSFANVLAEKQIRRARSQESQSVSGTAPSIKTYAEVKGRIFDDAEFAKEIENFEGVKVRTDKHINWGATGGHELNPEEIRILQEKYDITNLTPQEFYNLMADLTQLNAILPDDVVYKYYYTATVPFPKDGNVIIITFTGEIAKAMYDGFREQPVANYMKLLLDGRKFFSDGYDFIRTPQFQEDNAFTFNRYPTFLADFEPHFRECYNANERLISIFSQLVREGSPWANIETEVPLNENMTLQRIPNPADTLRTELTSQKAVSSTFLETALSDLLGKYTLPKEYWNDPIQYFMRLLQKDQ